MAKYYWLKLQADFFETEEIKIIESMPNGFIYSNFYLKLLCKSLKTEGRLMFKDIIPYTPDMLANITGVPVDTVRVALDLFIKLGLMQKLDDGALYMLAVQEMTGASTKWAEYKKNQRLKNKEKLALENKEQKVVENKEQNKSVGEPLDNVQKEIGHKLDNVQNNIGHSLDNVHQEKEIESEIDKESYSHSHNIYIIKNLFESFGVNFSKKHSDYVSELLKKNSVTFWVNHFTKQYEILKNNPAVKNVPAVFSKHLFAGTCELDPMISQKEKKWEKQKETEKNIENVSDSIIEIFTSLPEEKQEEIENKILETSEDKTMLLQFKKNASFVYYKMISQKIREILEQEKLIE